MNFVLYLSKILITLCARTQKYPNSIYEYTTLAFWASVLFVEDCFAYAMSGRMNERSDEHQIWFGWCRVVTILWAHTNIFNIRNRV